MKNTKHYQYKKYIEIKNYWKLKNNLCDVHNIVIYFGIKLLGIVKILTNKIDEAKQMNNN